MRARFLKPYVDARRVLGTKRRILLARFGFYSAKLKRWIVADRGFEYDGPSFALIINGDGEASSCIHDLMYSRPDEFTRAEADTVLRECLKAEGMGGIRRNAWYLGVRAVGWNHYGKERDETDLPIDPSGGA